MATKLIEFQQGGLRFLAPSTSASLELEHRRLDGTAFKLRSHPRRFSLNEGRNEFFATSGDFRRSFLFLLGGEKGIRLLPHSCRQRRAELLQSLLGKFHLTIGNRLSQ